MSKNMPNAIALRDIETQAKQKLKHLFDSPLLHDKKEHLKIGLRKLAEQGEFARMLTLHMERQGISTIEELAHLLDIDNEEDIDLLEHLRFPFMLRHLENPEYAKNLVEMCDLDIDIRSIK